MKTLMDESMSTQPDIYFEAGDHETLIHMRTEQFMRDGYWAEFRGRSSAESAWGGGLSGRAFPLLG